MRAAVTLACVFTGSISLGASADDTIRCRNGRLVNVGMTASEVSSRCGDPKSRTVEEIPVLARQIVPRAIRTTDSLRGSTR